MTDPERIYIVPVGKEGEVHRVPEKILNSFLGDLQAVRNTQAEAQKNGSEAQENSREEE